MLERVFNNWPTRLGLSARVDAQLSPGITKTLTLEKRLTLNDPSVPHADADKAKSEMKRISFGENTAESVAFDVVKKIEKRFLI